MLPFHGLSRVILSLTSMEKSGAGRSRGGIALRQAPNPRQELILHPTWGSPPIFRDDKYFLPLQAADLYAWYLRHAWHLRRRLGRAVIVPLRPAEIVIEPLNLLGVVFNEARLADIRDTMIGIGKRFAAEHPDIRMMATGGRRKRP
jgi:hypothetical protein